MNSARFLAASALALVAGCAVDPMRVDGRNGNIANDYPTVMRVAAASRNAGDPETALGLYRKAVALSPLMSEPYIGLGNTLLSLGDPNEAITAYQTALERSPQNLDALRGLANAYLQTGRPELAIAPLTKARDVNPSDPKLLASLGVAADLAGDHMAAQARYREGLTLDPNDAALRTNLAVSLAITSDYASAISTMRPLGESAIATPKERQTMALIYGLAGDRTAASRLARADLDQASAEHNLGYYETLRALPPDARAKAIASTAWGSTAGG